ncbi:MAG: hypothetical protein MJ136_01230 [Clostridia bacterium]|nr:hypothetical protein [Clostridia bacterium]
MQDMVLIINFDDSSSRAIARSLRAERIYCRIVSASVTENEIAAAAPMGLILSGAPAGAAAEPAFDPAACQLPVLALGAAAVPLARALGAEVQQTALCDKIGHVRFLSSPLTRNLEDCDRLLSAVRRLRLPSGVEQIAECEGEVIGFADTTRQLYGMQYTMESNDTDGMSLLMGFVTGVCGCSRWWDYEAFVQGAVEDIRSKVGDGRALCSMTGGLDSGVSALLAHKALGDRLQCVFIDTGLMRDREGERFLTFYRDQMGLNICHVHAEERFLQALKGVRDPQEKKAIIGDVLQRVLDETLANLGQFSCVIRGTICTEVMNGTGQNKRPVIYPDLPRIEPLRELFKSEVREAGSYMGMPAEVVVKQTFPGSGLALRVLGEVTPARLQTLRAADAIFTDELNTAGQLKRVRQHFCLLMELPGSSTRSVIVLKAVNIVEGAQQYYPARLPADLLERVTTRILHDRPEVEHVLYDLTASETTGRVEWQ